MRLSRPLYESLPFVYAAIGAFAIGVSYVDPQSLRAAATFIVGFLAEIAALTLYLRRRGYREMRREYSGGEIAPPDCGVVPPLARPQQGDAARAGRH